MTLGEELSLLLVLAVVIVIGEYLKFLYRRRQRLSVFGESTYRLMSGVPRSGHWPTLRKAHLSKHPTCAVCGGRDKLQVHHIQPYHLDPSLELEPTNLITLCESGANGMSCHLVVGHLGSFRSFNVNVKLDAAHWAKKIKERP